MEQTLGARRRESWLMLLTCMCWPAVLLSVLSGCSYSFDSGPRELPLSDRRVDETKLPQVQGFSLLGFPPMSRIELAADGRPWLSAISGSNIRLVAIDAPEKVWEFSSDQNWPIYDAKGRLAGVLLLELPGARFPAGRATRFRLGGAPSDLPLPAGDVHLQLSANTVVSWSDDKTPAALHLTRWQPDDSVQAVSTPWPPAIDGRQLAKVTILGERAQLVAYTLNSQQTTLQLVSDGSTFDLGMGGLNRWVESQGYVIYTDGEGKLRVYFVDIKKDLPLDIALGRTDDYLAVAAARVSSGFVVCNQSGLVAVDLDVGKGMIAGPPRLLDPAPCAGVYLDSSRITSDVIQYFTIGTDFHAYRVPFDGSAAPELMPGPPPTMVPEGGRVLNTCGREVAYTLTPLSADTNPGSDGWVRGWRFTQQGWGVLFSNDCRRVRWFEHAESADFPSEFLSAGVEYGAITRLARSVAANQELPDGRLLVNAGVYPGGSSARLELIDEDLGEAQLLLDSGLQILGIAPVPRGDGSPAQWEREVLLESFEAGGISTLRLLKLPPR